MPREQRTWGFRDKTVAQDAKNLTGNRDVEHVEGRVRGGGGVRLYRFTMNEAWSSGVADSDILEMDGTDTGIDADVLDPLSIFSSMTTGDAGLCIKQNGVYYVIQAPCPA